MTTDRLYSKERNHCNDIKLPWRYSTVISMFSEDGGASGTNEF